MKLDPFFFVNHMIAKVVEFVFINGIIDRMIYLDIKNILQKSNNLRFVSNFVVTRQDNLMKKKTLVKVTTRPAKTLLLFCQPEKEAISIFPP